MMSLSWQERQAGCRDGCTCFPSPIYKRNWVFGIWGTWQGSHEPHGCSAKGNPPPPSRHAQGSASLSSVRRGQRWETEDGNSPCSSLELCHSRQLLHQKTKGVIHHREDRKSHFCTWEKCCESGELCWSHRAAWSWQPQHTRVHQICKWYWFICTALYKQPSHSPHGNSSSWDILRG